MRRTNYSANSRQYPPLAQQRVENIHHREPYEKIEIAFATAARDDTGALLARYIVAIEPPDAALSD